MKELLLILFALVYIPTANAQFKTFTPVCAGTNDTAAFSALITTIGSVNARLVIPRLTTPCAVNNLTIPANVTLDFSDGGQIKVNTGQTLTIVGPPEAAARTIFVNALAAQGTVSFSGNKSINTIYPEWWGATGDYTALAGLSITSGTAVLTGSGFVTSDVGKSLSVYVGGTGGEPLKTTILSFQSSTQVTLAANAGTTVSAGAGYKGTDSSLAFNAAALALGSQPTIIQAGSAQAYLFANPFDLTKSNVISDGNGSTAYGDTNGKNYGTSVYAGSLFRLGDRAAAPANYPVNITVRGWNFRNIGQTASQTVTGSEAGYYTTLNGVSVTYNRRRNKQVNTDAAIWIGNARNVVITNNTSVETGHFISTESGYPPNGGEVSNNYIKDWGNVGIMPGTGMDLFANTLEQNAEFTSSNDHTADLGTSHAFYIANGFNNISIHHNRVTNARFYAVQINSTGNVYGTSVHDNTFIACSRGFYAGGSGAHVISFHRNQLIDSGTSVLDGPASVVDFADNIISGSVPDLDSLIHLKVNKGDVRVLRNRFSYTNTATFTFPAFVYIGGGNDLSRAVIQGNIFPTTSTTWGTTYGVRVDSLNAVTTLIIDGGNHFFSGLRFYAATSGGAANTIIDGNFFSEVTSGEAIYSEVNGLKVINNIFKIQPGGRGLYVAANNGSGTTSFIGNTVFGTTASYEATRTTAGANSSVIRQGNTYDGYATFTDGASILYSSGEILGAGGGSGTVTSVSVTTANGVSGSVATATTTPAITLSVAAASDTLAGLVELATVAETTTGSDAIRAITPDGLAGSTIFGTKTIELAVVDFMVDTATGDGKSYFRIPSGMNGMNLVSVAANVITAGTTGTTTVQVARCVAAATGSVCSSTVVDMLSTAITIDSGENDAATAAIAAIINSSNDDVATGQLLRVDIDAISTTPAKGLLVILTFQLP